MSAPSNSGGIVGTAIDRPVGVLVGVLLVLLFGMLSISGIPIQLTPDIEVPTLEVQTNWPGAAPVEVEAELLVEQEEVLKSLQGLEHMTSEAQQDRGTITLEMAVGTDIDEALVRVTNKLAQVPSYPDAADQPVVSTGRGSGPPLAVVQLFRIDDGDVAPYRTWFQQEVLPQLERIKGVAKIDYFGGQDTEVHVSYDPEGLAARGVTVARLISAVQGELRDVSGGDLEQGKRRYVVRTLAAPEELVDLEEIVLDIGPEGQPIRLGDVAKVATGLRKPTAKVFGNNKEAIALLFRREAGSNVLEVTEEILAEVDRIDQEMLAPVGLTLKVVSDQSAYINGALALVRNNLVLGGGLAVLVLLVFLRSFRASAVVAVAIPVCIIGTMLGMALLGRTVNVVSLAGMAFAVGMVVDNAIVVMESIDAKRRTVADAAQAALEGTQEVWGALVASSLTTAAVFLPIIAWQDEVGELLRDVAIAVSCAVGLSLAVSVLVIPSFAAKIVKSKPIDDNVDATDEGALANALGAFAGWWAKGLPRAAVMSFTVLGSTALIAWLLVPPMEYLPTGNRNFLFGLLVPPPGYSVSELIEVGETFQGGIEKHVKAEVDGEPAIERSFFVARVGLAVMGASAEDPGRIGDLVGLYRKNQAQFPGFFGVANQASLFGRGIGSSRAVDVDVTGASLTEIIGVAGPLMGKLSDALPGAQIRPIPGLDLGAPELQVTPRRQDAAALGLSGAQIGAVVDAVVDGRIVGELGREGRPNLDVVVRAQDLGAKTFHELSAAPIATPSGRIVPLSAVADLRETVGPATIQRIERRRAITLQVSPPDNIALEDAMRIIREDVLGPMTLPPEVRINLAGTADDLTIAKNRFGSTLLLAVLISFLLMSALFEDFLAPIVILVTVPMAAAGGVAALRLVDFFLGPQPFDMLTAVGFVLLIGVVVNNAILVVDGALARLAEGAPLVDAVEASVARRVRPILMSTLTSLAGLLPLVLFPGSGSELYRGVGAVVLGGLTLSTVLTLFVVPAVFAVVWRLTGRA